MSGLGLDLGRRWILVDCGEGTQQQIMRSMLKISRIEAVLITHLHGDHVLGLPGLLGTMAMEGRTEPLQVVAPVGIRSWIDAMLALPILQLPFPIELIELSGPLDLGYIAGLRVATLPLRHRVPSFGFRFVAPDRPGTVDVAKARALGIEPGPKLGMLQRGETVDGVRPEQVIGPPRKGQVVAVMGDTTYCAASVELARDGDLLVHECTYSKADHALCEQWKHSCTDDVARVVRESGVRKVLLTHFSTRHPLSTLLVDEVRTCLGAGVDAEVIAAVERNPIEV